MPKYSKLSIDGVVGDIYDEEAIHEDNVLDVVINVINAPEIRTLLLNIYHPVGSYYFTDRNVNPGTFLGGTWETVEGRFLIGASEETYPVNSTGGSADAVVVEHDHVGSTNSSGAHIHTVSGTAASAGNHAHYAGSKRYNAYGKGNLDALMQYGYNGNYTGSSAAGAHTHSISGSAASGGAHTHEVTVESSGESGIGKNLPPYIAAYIWVRTA